MAKNAVEGLVDMAATFECIQITLSEVQTKLHRILGHGEAEGSVNSDEPRGSENSHAADGSRLNP